MQSQHMGGKDRRIMASLVYRPGGDAYPRAHLILALSHVSRRRVVRGRSQIQSAPPPSPLQTGAAASMRPGLTW